MEEDEDRFLLSSLGVTSANPEDIEQTILDEVILLVRLYVFGISCCIVDSVRCFILSLCAFEPIHDTLLSNRLAYSLSGDKETR